MTISTNIKSLRYFYVKTGNDRINVTLDISNTYPVQLQVYRVEYSENQTVKFSESITGHE